MTHVAVRDGEAGAWKAGTPVADYELTAEVHGAYRVMFVCGVAFYITVVERFQTVEDDHAIVQRCDYVVPPSGVVGHMVQAGAVYLGDQSESSDQPDWDFGFGVSDGTYDLFAATADRVAVRRGIQAQGEITLATPVDVAQEGTPLVGAAFTVTNLAVGETAEAEVGLLNATNRTLPATLYVGPSATALVAPDAALLASDVQSVALRARTATGVRALRRPFRVGGDTAFTVPDGITGLAWSTDGILRVRWSKLPEMESHTFSVSQHEIDTGRSQTLIASRNYLAAVGADRLALDTDVPGVESYGPLLTKQYYHRSVALQSGTALETLSSVSLDEDVAP